LHDKHTICRYTDTHLTEDRVTLGSDPSAVRIPEHGAVKLHRLALHYAGL
jgi:hypothetical protein